MYHSGVVSAYRQRDRELRRLGVQVTLLTARRWNEGGGGVTVEKGDDDFVVAARTVGHHPYVFVYDPRPLWRLLRNGRFDVIDVHEEPASLAAAEMLLLRRVLQPTARLVFYSAQNLEKRYPPPFRWIERLALRSAKAIHCCSSGAAVQLRAKGFCGALPVLGLGLDVDRFQPADDVGSKGYLRVGYVGRIEERKGVRVLVAAMAAVPDATLEIVGGGPDRQGVDGDIEGLGLRSRVRVRGFLAHEELPELYRSWDVLCVPSLATSGWIEQFGRVAVEAMASGVAVVASDIGSLPEVVGDAGLLMPAGDVAALAEALRRLAREPDLRARLGARGRERAQAFSWPAIAEAHKRVYVEVLS